MKTILAPLAGAGLAVLLLAGAAAGADPGPTSNWATPVPAGTPGTTPAAAATPEPAVLPAPATTPAPAATTTPASAGMLAAILGLTDAQVHDLRLQGKSLADIARQQGVDPQKLIDALAAVWGSRIDARLAAGAITADQAATLKADVKSQAGAMVNQVTPGGMGGAAVGAGPNGMMRGQGSGAMRGQGNGMRGGAMGGGRTGAGRMGAGRMGAGAGTGTCPATTTPSS
jgi:hypothetical protein